MSTLEVYEPGARVELGEFVNSHSTKNDHSKRFFAHDDDDYVDYHETFLPF